MLSIAIDGTGVPMTTAGTAGRDGKGEDGKARTREVKLCCVFTQTTVDDDGYPVRDPHSSSYLAWDEQGEDRNHEVFPDIVDVRDVPRANGVPARRAGQAYPAAPRGRSRARETTVRSDKEKRSDLSRTVSRVTA